MTSDDVVKTRNKSIYDIGEKEIIPGSNCCCMLENNNHNTLHTYERT